MQGHWLVAAYSGADDILNNVILTKSLFYHFYNLFCFCSLTTFCVLKQNKRLFFFLVSLLFDNFVWLYLHVQIDWIKLKPKQGMYDKGVNNPDFIAVIYCSRTLWAKFSSLSVLAIILHLNLALSVFSHCIIK